MANNNLKNVVGVRFVSGVKIYYFDPSGFELKRGDYVVVESQQGDELAKVIYEQMEINLTEIPDEEILKVKREATQSDKAKVVTFHEQKANYLRIANEMATKSRLVLHFIDVSQSLDDSSRLLFLFAAEGRVDFRDLIVALNKKFGVSVRLYQVGPRDAARIVGGVGVCGQELCCSRFLNKFSSITMEMAREQDLANVGSNKISGVCGKLLCCLAYEVDMYKRLSESMLPLGQPVRVEGKLTGVVVERNVLAQTLVVSLDENNLKKTYAVSEVKAIA